MWFLYKIVVNPEIKSYICLKQYNMGYKKDINPSNAKGNFHGYHEWYDNKGDIFVRVNFNDSIEIGYEEIHSTEEESSFANFYIR